MILTEIGEVGVHVGNDVYVLRPSLYAMTRIGPPGYIVEAFAAVMAEGLVGRPAEIQMGYAFEVLQACTEDDIEFLIGSYEHIDTPLGGKFVHRPGLIPPNEMLLLARCLMRHGVTGSVEPLPKDKDSEEDEDGEEDKDFTSEFDARLHVANATAHLGMSEKEAWNTTMTALVDALRVKFPVVKDESKIKGKAPSKSEYDELMEIADRIEAKRKLKLGIKD